MPPKALEKDPRSTQDETRRLAENGVREGTIIREPASQTEKSVEREKLEESHARKLKDEQKWHGHIAELLVEEEKRQGDRSSWNITFVGGANRVF